MCEAIAGQLIVSHDREDHAALHAVEELSSRFGPSLVLDLDEILHGLESHTALPTAFHLLTVPPGAELSAGAELLRAYEHADGEVFLDGDLDPDHGDAVHIGERAVFRVTPNLRLSASQNAGRNLPFTLSATHSNDYLPMVGGGRTGEGVTVAIVDSGIDPAMADQLNVASQVDAASTAQGVALDDHGHGSLIARLIEEVAPGATFRIIRVLDG